MSGDSGRKSILKDAGENRANLSDENGRVGDGREVRSSTNVAQSRETDASKCGRQGDLCGCLRSRGHFRADDGAKAIQERGVEHGGRASAELRRQTTQPINALRCCASAEEEEATLFRASEVLAQPVRQE